MVEGWMGFGKLVHAGQLSAVSYEPWCRSTLDGYILLVSLASFVALLVIQKTNCPSGDEADVLSWSSYPDPTMFSFSFLFFLFFVLWLHKLVFRFRFCKAMVPACARVLDAVHPLSLKVIYFTFEQKKSVIGGSEKWEEFLWGRHLLWLWSEHVVILFCIISL